jgi:abortive infection alpha-like protein
VSSEDRPPEPEPETVEGEIVPPRKEGPEGFEALPGLAALAAGAALRTAEWSARTGMRAGMRLLQVAAHPDTAPEAIHDLRRNVREAARELTGVEDLEERVARALPDQVTDRWPSLPPPPEQRDNGKGREETLAERGDELLRRSSDVRYEEEAHPAYERILSELAPDEGRVLRLLLLQGPQPSVDVRTGGPLGMVSSRLIAPGLNMIGARAGCRYVDRVPQYLNNLFRLGLVWFSRETLRDPLPYQVVEAQPEVLEAMKSVRFAKAVRRSIHLTPFGEDFCRVALNLGRDVDLASLPDHGSLEAMERQAVPDSRPRAD